MITSREINEIIKILNNILTMKYDDLIDDDENNSIIDKLINNES